MDLKLISSVSAWEVFLCETCDHKFAVADVEDDIRCCPVCRDSECRFLGALPAIHANIDDEVHAKLREIFLLSRGLMGVATTKEES